MKLEYSLKNFEKKKKLKYQVSTKSFQWEPSCNMRTDGQTDMTKRLTTYTRKCCFPGSYKLTTSVFEHTTITLVLENTIIFGSKVILTLI